MKKYIIVIVLAVLVVMFELYAFAQKLTPTSLRRGLLGSKENG